MPEIVKNLKFCDNCGQPITYEKDEVFRLNNETVGFYCPNCGQDIVVNHTKPFAFPDSFHRVNVSNGAAELTEEETQQLVNNVKYRLQHCLNPGEGWTSACGDTIAFGLKAEDEDYIVIAKGYWEDFIRTE